MAEEEKNKQAEEEIKEEVQEEVKSSAGAVAQAEALIKLKEKTDDGLLAMKELKEAIKPTVMEEPVRTPNGVVSFVSGSAGKFLDKNLVRQVLMEQLHLSQERADQIINSASMEKIIASYVKVTPS
jgi:Flp pilus assembly CpaF family ATPase